MSRSASDAKVIVVGSLNHDITRYVHRLPVPGETVFATRAATTLGGKGANQAAAAALVGASVVFIGAVGADMPGDAAREALSRMRIDVTALDTSDTPTGTALITVDANGENAIVVDSGANLSVDADAVYGTLRARANQRSIVLCQGELRADVVDAAAAASRAIGARFVLNLAPVIDVLPHTLRTADPLVVNEIEAAQLLQSPSASASGLRRLFRTDVVVTRGAAGVQIADDSGESILPALAVAQVVDSTGAGDAFTGVLAAALARGQSLTEAAAFGVVAGGVAVGRAGTIDSYPRPVDLPGWSDSAFTERRVLR